MKHLEQMIQAAREAGLKHTTEHAERLRARGELSDEEQRLETEKTVAEGHARRKREWLERRLTAPEGIEIAEPDPDPKPEPEPEPVPDPKPEPDDTPANPV